MASQLHDTGEQFVLDYTFPGGVTKPTSLKVGLFDDSTDTLADSDDYGAITTEPTDGNYAQQTISFDGTGFSTAQPQGAGTAWQADSDVDIQFDVTNTTGSVDSYYVVVNYDASGDGTANDHLFWTGDLSQTYDLSNNDTLTLNSGGLGISLD